ncbi:VanZ family protein [Intestinibacillus massiliensis]|nr:VanZ family protein [Intestinibacillus massiliensis]
MGVFKKALRALADAALALYLLFNIYAEHSGRFIVPVGHKLAFAAGFIALWTLAVFAFAPPGQDAEARRRRMRRYLLGLFLYYVWILCNMLFFDAAFGRAPRPMRQDFRFYAVDINLEPFKTVRNYLRALEHGRIRGSIVAINLLGNLAAFAPMGFFLPALCRPMRNVFLFVLGVAAMVCCVEVTQIVTMTGSCDIDDLILNTMGALSVWLIVQLPFIRRHAYRAVPPRPKKGKGL